MNLDKMTIKAQEAMEQALNIATGNGQQAVETGHILKGILIADENVSSYLLKKLDVNVNNFTIVLDKITQSYPKVSGGNSYLSTGANTMIQEASKIAKEFNDSFVSIEHLLIGLLSVEDAVSRMMKDNGITVKTLKAAVFDLRKGANVTSQTAEDSFNALNRFAINLNDRALSGKLDPVIGRDDEIRRILQILTRRTKNNPILLGEPGVGKTAIAEGLAHRIVRGDIPENLKDKQLFSLDMGALIAGAKYKGEFEERLKSVVREVISADGEIILFIDEIHTLIGAGKSDGAMDAANILKPALARGDLRAIGATTLDEYQKYFEKDKALERRFQPVMVNEPDTLSAISILRGLKERYESHHKVRIKDDAIIASVELSQRYISDRFLPDKAIDLIDEAASKLRLEMNSVPEEIDEINRRTMQLEIEREALKREGADVKIKELNRELANLNERLVDLNAKWLSEKEIVEQIQQSKKHVEALKLDAERLEREGDYGRVAEIRYGKIKETEALIDKLSHELQTAQGDNALIDEEVDAEDIAEIVARWTGIPVSRMLQSERQKLLHLEEELHQRIVGQEEAIQAIADAVRRSRAGLHDEKKPIGSFIFLGSTGVGKTELARALAEFLFNDENMMTRIDMSEYQERHSISRLIGAPPGYVGYDEGGQLTEAVRRKPYSVVLLDEIDKAHPDIFNILLQLLDDGRLTDNKGRVVNFKNTIVTMTSNIGSHIILEGIKSMKEGDHTVTLLSLKEQVFELLKKAIRPEFLNRIDEVVMFEPLSREEVSRIVRIQFARIVELMKKQHFKIDISDIAVEKIADIGYDPQFGARPIKRMLQKHLLNELSKSILAGKIDATKKIFIDFRNNEFLFVNNEG